MKEDFRLKSLLTPATFGVPLVMTLGLLLLYHRTRHALVLTVLAGTTLLWWVLGIGLSDGFYNHTLNLVLSAVIVASVAALVSARVGHDLRVAADERFGWSAPASVEGAVALSLAAAFARA